MTGSGPTKRAAPSRGQGGDLAGGEAREAASARPRAARKPRRRIPEPAGADGEDPRAALGRRVNRLRVALGVSQEAFADQVGLDRTYISGIERGLRNPTLLVLLRLARALGVPPAKLLEEE